MVVGQETGRLGVLGPLALSAPGLAPSWQWAHWQAHSPLQSRPPGAGQPLPCSEEHWARLVLTRHFTSVMAPEGYSNPRQCQPGPLKLSLYSNLLRQMAPIRAVGVQRWRSRRQSKGSRPRTTLIAKGTSSRAPRVDLQLGEDREGLHWASGEEPGWPRTWVFGTVLSLPPQHRHPVPF